MYILWYLAGTIKWSKNTFPLYFCYYPRLFLILLIAIHQWYVIFVLLLCKVGQRSCVHTYLCKRENSSGQEHSYQGEKETSHFQSINCCPRQGNIIKFSLLHFRVIKQIINIMMNYYFCGLKKYFWSIEPPKNYKTLILGLMFCHCFLIFL